MSRPIASVRAAAEEQLPPVVWDYVETGAGAEISLEEAENAWQHWRLRPRVLRDVRAVTTRTTLLGQELASPVIAAPTAFHRVYHPEGELASVAGAGAAGSLYCLSTRSTTSIEDVGAAATEPWWMQVYVTVARDITEAMVLRAVEAGACALVLTGDTPYLSWRTRSARALPLDDEAAMVNAARHLDGRDLRCLEEDAGLTAETIDWLADLSGLPVLVKGVLRGDDARECLDAGAAGIVVSTHGGRQLDRVVPTAQALPEVVDAVAGEAPVVVDGGIRSGYDVLTALALGADSVMVGRPVIYGLATAGADGVRDVLAGLTDHVHHLLGLAGVTSPAELDRSFVTPRSG
ncbi:alpha-hydroxy acid oxidase [Luteipulveratus sp. YIM 133132]|uniref:alpha-hydroxy acid oxidase n=1 Tax=Luteipulveratus flavus TaxID=3031728 RepID=UPI0023AF073E|nr:alpha-hydroxy acid oxidase [Luteipulveratus sp. YIM 133132]MDE9366790.1 alpha-hydroxy acid oxidase [Luteipulveratus sp. YIM 133132]